MVRKKIPSWEEVREALRRTFGACPSGTQIEAQKHLHGDADNEPEAGVFSWNPAQDTLRWEQGAFFFRSMELYILGYTLSVSLDPGTG
eukprot:1853210-Prorocentrum_lima.AAC.1